MEFTALPLIIGALTPITQGHKGGQVGLALGGEPCCLSQITSLFSIFPNMASSMIHFKSSQAQR